MVKPSEMVSRIAKQQWFDQGAAALMKRFPKAPSYILSPETPKYACPLCAEYNAATKRFTLTLHEPGALTTGELTAEHFEWPTRPTFGLP